MGADAGGRVADPVVVGVGAAAEEREAGVDWSERGLQLYGLFVLGKMKGAKELEVFELDLLRWVERSAGSKSNVNIARTREDDVALDAVVFEPWVAREVEACGPRWLRGGELCGQKGMDRVFEARCAA